MKLFLETLIASLLVAGNNRLVVLATKLKDGDSQLSAENQHNNQMIERQGTDSYSPWCPHLFGFFGCDETQSLSSTMTAHLTLKSTAQSDYFSLLTETAQQSAAPSFHFVTISTDLISSSTTSEFDSISFTDLPPVFGGSEETSQPASIQSGNIVLTVTGVGATGNTPSTTIITNLPAGTVVPQPSIGQPAASDSSTLGPPATTPSNPPSTSSVGQSSNVAAQSAVTQSTSNVIAAATTTSPNVLTTSQCPTTANEILDLGSCNKSTEQDSGGSDFGTGAITGTAVAGIVFITLIAVLLWYYCRRKTDTDAADLERVKDWIENSLPGSRPAVTEPVKNIGATTASEAHNNVDISPTSGPGPAIVTEDVICNYNQACLRASRDITSQNDPFKTPPDNIDSARTSQIGVALTRYSTHGSQPKKSSEEEEHNLPPTVSIRRGRDAKLRSVRAQKAVPRVVDIGKTKLSPAKPIRRVKSFSSLAERTNTETRGSPQKLSKYFDVHTGCFLNPGSSRADIEQKPVLSGLTKSSTDPKLDDKINLEPVEAGNEESTDRGSSEIVRSRPLSEVFYTPHLPGAFPHETLAGNSTSKSRPPITECELLDRHVCDPKTRYKCHFSTVQLSRIAGAVKRYNKKQETAASGKNGDENEKLQEEKVAWARNLLKQREQQEKQVVDAGTSSSEE